MVEPNGHGDEKKTWAGSNFLVAEPPKARYHVRITGLSALKMDAMSEERIVDVLIRENRDKPDPTRQLDKIAAGSLYRDKDNKICIPAVNLAACLRGAGRKVPYGAKAGRGKVTMSSGQTQLFSFLKIEQKTIPLIVPQTGVNNEGWEVDVCKGKLPNGTAVGIVRPRFDEWSLEFDVTVTITGPEVTPKMIGSLFQVAGRSLGLGAHNPAHSGPFGTFKVDSWELVEYIPGEQLDSGDETEEDATGTEG